jgi:hypothetical protein
VEVVDILCDYLNIEVFFEFNESKMCSVGLNSQQLATSLIIEMMNERRVTTEAVCATYLHYRIFLPQAVSIAEGSHSALCADTCAG